MAFEHWNGFYRDRIETDEGKRRHHHSRCNFSKCRGRDDLHAPAVKRNRGSKFVLGGLPIEEKRKPIGGLLNVGGSDNEIDQTDGSVRMLKPSWLPYGFFGPMRQNLYPPLGHLAGRDARNGERRDVRPNLGRDRPLHVDQRLNMESRGLQSPMGGGRVADRERREMNAGIARDGIFEFAAKRRVGGLEQGFDIAAMKHGSNVAGPGRTFAARGIGVDLD
jgi:hypothetical protein